MPSHVQMRLATLSGLILLAIPLASCQTTASGGIDPALVACSSFKPVRWSKSDTADTVAQIKEHNAAGKALCGWGEN
ncbi:hypothetical protein CRBSH125_00830 [Afipia carboxidovorans]|nr:hypothetical protein CRBSH125_00830 [Afipia carboxidovorans]